MQQTWCEGMSDAHDSVKEYFEHGLPSKYNSIDDLGLMFSNDGEKLNLALLCNVFLPREQHSYLPGDTEVEFYRVVKS